MLLVVAYHVSIAIPSVLHLPIDAPKFVIGGALAVPFFFVISGFLLYLPAVRHGGRLGPIRWYAERRFVRLVPPYWLMVTGLLFVWPFVFEVPSPFATTDGVRALLAHLVFLQQAVLGPPRYGFTFDVGFGVNAAVWSLTTEAVFYVLLPVICGAFHRRPRVSLASGLAVSVLWRFGSRHLSELASAVGAPVPAGWLGGFLFHQVPAYAWPFAVGMFAAECFVRVREHPFFGGRGATYLHVVCAAGLLVGVYLAGTDPDGPSFFHDYPRDLVPAVLLGTLLVVASLGSKRAAWPYSNRVSRFLGDVSYGAFLWHMVLIQIVWRVLDLPALGVTRATLALAALVLPGSLVAGLVSRMVIERPLVQFLRMRQARRVMPAAQGARA